MKSDVSQLQLYLGDCLEVMKDIPDKSIDMILADLPYGTTSCHWDTIIPFDDLWKQYKRIIKENGVIALFGRAQFGAMLVFSNMKNYRHKWIWNKKQSGSFHNAKYMPLQIEEEIFIFGYEKVNFYPIMREGILRKRGGAKKTNQTMHGGFIAGYENISNKYYPTNIIEIANPRKDRKHPTQKPVTLLEYLIKTYTTEGQIVLDNVMGSGSTGVACVNTNRNFVGIELDENYFKIAEARIADAERT